MKGSTKWQKMDEPFSFNKTTEVISEPARPWLMLGRSVASPLEQGERTKVKGSSTTGFCLNKP